MSEDTHQDRPVVVIACRVFEHWIDSMLKHIPGLDGNVTFYDYALHVVPKKLGQTIQAAIDAVEQPSLIILGYGLCGNGMNNISSGKHYLLIPRTDDCIAVILGSYEAYRREIKKEPGTYYLSRGWLEGGSNPLQEYNKYEDKYGPEKAAWLMDYQYHNYKRLMLVARNSQELDQYRAQAQEVADYCAQWGVRYEEMIGSDDYLKKLVEIAAHLEKMSDDFLLIPPGGKLTNSQFLRGG